MNHCLFKAKDTKGAVGNTVDYSSLTKDGRCTVYGLGSWDAWSGCSYKKRSRTRRISLKFI